ncbi:MAG TPA: oligosaccharide flippase family protein, partial [Polyangiaceae bacterium]|nr:oligosaccharide flippase family protein [Polyangiaceae bacterium]
TVSGEAALSGLLLWLLSRRQPGSFRISAARSREMGRLLRSSWPLAISALSVILYMRIDQVMLGKMLGDHAVGVFSAAVRISEFWYFVPIAIAAAVAPPLTAAHQSNEVEYRRKLLTFVRGLTWIGIVAAVVLSLMSRRVIHVLYGSGYEQASSVLAVHAWAGVFACLGLASGPWFVNAGLFSLRMTYTLLGAIANCVINLYAIPRYGPIGAAAATLVSYCLAGFVLNAFSARSRPVFMLQMRALTFR